MRLGVASAYFRHHTITKVTKGLIDRLNRDRFHVTVFHLGPEDAWTDAVRASADRAIRLTGSLAEMRATIADEALDVLFYPDIGMHAATYFLAFARLAPVQCVSWGHPETTGIPNVDDYLSSADLEPDGSESEYAERLVRFQRLPTYFYRPDVTGITSDRERFGLPDGYRLYVCPQLMFKLHPDFDRVMADILRRDPQGMLVFLEGAKGAASHRWTLFRDRFMRAHSDVANRVLVRPFLDHNDFMTLIATADVLLDPIYFGGGNTSLEALAIGTPIVTWPGPFARGRTTYACFRRMGVLDSVVASLDEYAERAVGLAMDHAWNADVRARIQQRNHRLYEDETVIEEFETYFETVAANARLRDRHVRKDPAR